MTDISASTIGIAVDAGVATLRLARPEALNALTKQMIGEMLDALEQLKAAPEVRSLLLTGEGRGFCAGMDLKDPLTALDLPREDRPAATRANMDGFVNALCRAFSGFGKPTVALVNGVAAGGGVGLALACDIVVAARSASFVQVFTPKLGLIGDMGATWHLPRAVGRARAKGMLMLGDRLPAEKAAEWGLIWSCVEDDMLEPTGFEIARRLANSPAQALALTSDAVDAGLRNSFDAQLDYERDVNSELNAQPDFAEGVAAFLEKRAPRFGQQQLAEDRS